MRALVGCEYSQIVTAALRDRGVEAYSCDILPTEGNQEWHIQGDVLDLLDDGWDLGIFHPVCRYLANSGVRWLYRDIDRWPKLFESAEFFLRLLNAPIEKIACENSIMHKYGTQLVGRKPDQIVQPWMFGDLETKGVALWLKNLPLLVPDTTTKPDGVIARVHNMPPGPKREKERSRFFHGIARAMAEQWIV